MELRSRFHIPEGIDAAAVDRAVARTLPRIVKVIGVRAYTNLSGRLVGVRRGLLRRGLVARVEGAGTTAKAVVGIQGRRGFVGRLLETGVRPHEIKARERLLRFRRAGSFFATASVQHPGVRPRRWLRTALEESSNDIELILRSEISAVMRERVLAERRRLRMGA